MMTSANAVWHALFYRMRWKFRGCRHLVVWPGAGSVIAVSATACDRR